VIGIGSSPEDVLDERVTACTSTPSRSVYSVQKLAHGDHADGAFLGAEELFERV